MKQRELSQQILAKDTRVNQLIQLTQAVHRLTGTALSSLAGSENLSQANNIPNNPSNNSVLNQSTRRKSIAGSVSRQSNNPNNPNNTTVNTTIHPKTPRNVKKDHIPGGGIGESDVGGFTQNMSQILSPVPVYAIPTPRTGTTKPGILNSPIPPSHVNNNTRVSTVVLSSSNNANRPRATQQPGYSSNLTTPVSQAPDRERDRERGGRDRARGGVARRTGGEYSRLDRSQGVIPQPPQTPRPQLEAPEQPRGHAGHGGHGQYYEVNHQYNHHREGHDHLNNTTLSTQLPYTPAPRGKIRGRGYSDPSEELSQSTEMTVQSSQDHLGHQSAVSKGQHSLNQSEILLTQRDQPRGRRLEQRDLVNDHESHEHTESQFYESQPDNLNEHSHSQSLVNSLAGLRSS